MSELPPSETKPLLGSSQRSTATRRIGLVVIGIALLALLGYICAQEATEPVSSAQTTANETISSIDNISTLYVQPTRPASCPQVAPHDRVVLFWQSEVGGCEQVPDGVTHVLFGFAQTFGGKLNPSFQTQAGVIAACVQQLRQRCIYSMGVIGGANNNQGMSTINDPYAFAASVKSFIDMYMFDGVDIDDETNYYEGLYNNQRVLAYMQALHNTLKTNGNNYVLSYDAYMMEAEPQCWKGTRCFARGIENLVDWVNVMAYNVATNPDHAGQVYAEATQNVFEHWANIVPREKLALGLCMGSACSYGPGPVDWVVKSWVDYNYAKSMGGMMIYAGSTDIATNFQTTRKIVQWMRASGASTSPQAWTVPPPTTPQVQVVHTTAIPTPPPRNAAECGSCRNCYYPTSNACFIGFTFLQCRTVGFTWCGQ